jgi:hypothetical protein
MFGLVSGGEDVVSDTAIDKGRVVLVKLGLDDVMFMLAGLISCSDLVPVWTEASHLPPFAVSAVDCSDQLRVVEIKQVRPDAHDWAVFVVELLDCLVVAASPDESKAPQVRIAW